ncbi:hypothetical protein NMB59_002563 [Salmonella enterica]|uniref:hypothetical protein n=1 Tax=Salmonella enterica TaxID=28901 RepID=UPI0009AE5A04|nr:hypothetical protein [Salmonella enterica]EHT5512497.1 hypothetical protein [Salmonella enterica subsp. enterica serovar Sandiego]HBJ6608855.1 hypothetical protein [Salmonella enterica subsp. enterica serovar 6,8:d:-]EHM3681376.1 hypothetical protein [Salmonella enterica]EHZ8457104.1 hypothetical protein [Salmonella enterica]EIC6300099.1 hypothetical protein [Salmonella enterica]
MSMLTTDGLTMNQLAERNAEYVMTIAELEEKCAAMTAKLSMINDLMEAAEQANKLAQEATETLVQESNALAAENAGLKSALNDILQPDAAVLERNHRVRVLDAMETPVTDDFLAEVRAQGVEMFADKYRAQLTALPTTPENIFDAAHVSLRYQIFDADEFAAQLRKGGAS